MVHEEEFQQKQMCSNSNGGGDGCGCSKKLKVQKVPQRGPGVAELEKILREQQKEEEDKPVVEGFSSVSPLPHRYHPHSSSTLFPPPPPPPTTTTTNSISSSNSLPRHVQLMQKPDLINPPPFSDASLYGNNNNNSQGGGGRGGGVGHGGGGNVSAIGGSSVVLPRNGYFPTMWRSIESNFNKEGPKSDSGFAFSMRLSDESSPISPSPHLLQRNCYRYPHSMMNLYPSSSASSSSTSSSAGLNHHTEHPSNQRSHYNYTSLWPEEDKMVGMKRPWPFSVDYLSGPFLHCNPPPFSPHMNRPDQSSTCSNCSTFNSEPKKTISRDANWRGLDGNILTLGSPMTPSPSTQTLKEEFSEFEFPLRNGSMEHSYQRSEPGGSVNRKPFYSFLLPKGQMGRGETTLSLGNDKSEAGGDSIDLNLKL